MNLRILFAAVGALLLMSNAVLAVPGVPHQFYGTVTLNSAPAPDGTSVVAKINGIDVASTTTSGGKYGYDPVFYIEDPSSVRTGSTIKFYVNGIDTGQTFIFSTAGITLLNLAATGGTTSGSTSGGGGGGGGGGSALPVSTGTTVVNNTTSTVVCQEKWLCSDWSACDKGVQTRTCVDQNECATNNNEPFTSQPCAAEEEQAEVQNSLLPTGFFLGLLSNQIALVAIVAVVAIAVLAFLFMRRRMTKSMESASKTVKGEPFSI